MIKLSKSFRKWNQKRDRKFQRKDKKIRGPRVPEKERKRRGENYQRNNLNFPRTEGYELPVQRVHLILSTINNFLKDPSQGTL